jgi:hypothetical protein
MSGELGALSEWVKSLARAVPLELPMAGPVSASFQETSLASAASAPARTRAFS